MEINMKKLEKCIDRLFAERTVENIAIRIGRNDKVLYETYRSGSSAIDSGTLFDMASVTKIVATTSLCLIAADKGLLSFDNKVSSYFTCPDDKKDMTIKHLLTHTMGIGHKALTVCGNTYDNIYEYILRIPSDKSIGSEVIYSCPGFILLGKILEKVFDDRLDRLFEKYVAAPLEMHSSSFLPNKSADIVNSNISEEDRGCVNDYNCRFLGGVAGNAGLFSCVSDMTKYAKMLLSFGDPIISRDTFGLAIHNYTPALSESRGLGFLYVDEKYTQTGKLFPNGSIGHCGHTGQSIFVDLKSGLYVIVLSDATASTIRKYGEENYGEVIKMREDIHSAIKDDLE